MLVAVIPLIETSAHVDRKEDNNNFIIGIYCMKGKPPKFNVVEIAIIVFTVQ